MAIATPPLEAVSPPTPGLSRALVPQPNLLVIFGAGGDLAWRKLLPAVYNLNVDGVLPAHFAVVGFGMAATPIQGDPDEWIRRRARDGIQRFSRRGLDEEDWTDFARALFFVEGSFGDARAYERLKARLASI